MMVMTAKVNLKKILLVLAGVAAAILALVLLFGGGGEDAQTTAGKVTDNDGRVQFLTDLGWQVTTSPVESGQVNIPKTEDAVFAKYNALQKSQGYDLSSYAGKTVMRYVYKINNFPGAEEPVYATILMYKNKIIGGDITDTSARGVMQGFKPQNPPQATQPTETSLPEETTAATE